MARKRRPLRWFGLLLLLAAVVYVVLRATGVVGGDKALEVETEPASRQTVIERVTESGLIQPLVELPLAPDVSGEVTAIYVQEGDFVERGAVLFEIRPDNYEAAYTQSQAAVDGAKADLKAAEAAVIQAQSTLYQDSVNLARTKKLFDRKAISEADLEQAQTRQRISQGALEAAKRQQEAAFYRVRNAQAALSQARTSLTQTRVVATMPGVVVKLSAKVGQRVVGTGMMKGEEVVKVADLSRMVVAVNINEADIVHVKPGDTAAVEVDAYPNRRFQGEVVEVGYAAAGKGTDELANMASEDQVTEYPVKVLIRPGSYASDPELNRNLPTYQSPFRPGMSAQVTIFTRRADSAVVAPLMAVTVRATGEPKPGEKPQEWVFVIPEGADTVDQRAVTTGINDDTVIVVQTGLQPGERLVTAPYTAVSRDLSGGDRVAIKPKAEPGEEGRGRRGRRSRP